MIDKVAIWYPDAKTVLHHCHTCRVVEFLFFFQNILDERLKHSNSGVVLATVHLFLHLTDDMPHLHQDVYDRIKCRCMYMYMYMFIFSFPSAVCNHTCYMKYLAIF